MKKNPLALRVCFLFVCMCLCTNFTIQGCLPPIACEPSDRISPLSIDPTGSGCQLNCECNNLLYEGQCIENVCQSFKRDECTSKGKQRRCVLAKQQGSCAEGRQECHPAYLQRSLWGDCEPIEKIDKESTYALCSDGIDNDCDGFVDLSDVDCKQYCNPGKIEICFTADDSKRGVGICKAGLRECKSDGTWGLCQGQVLPKTSEACNGKDDDCDGEIDNDSHCSCWPPSRKEPCYTAKDKTTQGKGSCKGGTRFCSDEGRWSECLGEQLPKQEDCNLQDDDCDGYVDNLPGDQTGTLTRPCYPSKEGCINQADGSCVPRADTLCKQGTQSCLGGNWGRCEGAKLPQAEQCNQQDDDCDGQVDEPEDLVQTAPRCANQRGGCRGAKAPVSSCQQGKWLPCDASTYTQHFPAYQAQEICDGHDNNCNGMVDEFMKDCVSIHAGSAVPGREDGRGTEARFFQPKGIAVYDKDTLYIADTGNHRIRRIGPCGFVTTIAGSGTPGFRDGYGMLAQFNSPHSLIVDKDENIYVLDTNNHMLRKIDKTGKVTTIAGTGTAGHEDGDALRSRLNKPQGLTRLSDGSFLIADTGNGNIRKLENGKLKTLFSLRNFSPYSPIAVQPFQGLFYFLSQKEHSVLTFELSDPSDTDFFAGGFLAGYVDGVKTQARFDQPGGLVLTSSGTFYIADTENHRIRTITSNGVVSTFAGSGIPRSKGGQGGRQAGKKTSAAFRLPTGLAYAHDTLYIVDTGNHGIRAIPTQSPSTPARCGTTLIPPQFGTNNALKRPVSVAIDPQNNVYVADEVSHHIWKRDSSGVVSLYAGAGPGFIDGTRTQARFLSPSGMVFDQYGQLYVADTGNHRIRKIASDGTVTTLAGTGQPGYKDGPGSAAQFATPTDIAIDAQGNLYVADRDNHRVRKIAPDRNVTTVAGNGIAGIKSGTGTAGQLSYPAKISIDTNGSLYVISSYQALGLLLKLVQKITPDRLVNTYSFGKLPNIQKVLPQANGHFVLLLDNRVVSVNAKGDLSDLTGSTKAAFGFQDGHAQNVLFHHPQDIAISQDGSIYIADTENSRLRMLLR